MSDILAFLARGLQLLLALGGAYLVALWFASIIWTFRDIESRSRSVVTQIAGTLLPLLFPFIGIPVYLILRPNDTLDSAYQRSLEEEYLLQDLEELPLCPLCQHFVEEDFLLCPHCHASLRQPCVACERLVDLRWTLCPYCGVAQSDEKVEQPIEVPAARWTAPAKRRRRPATPAAAASPAALSVVNRPHQSGAKPGSAAVASQQQQQPRQLTNQHHNRTEKGATGRFSPSQANGTGTESPNGKTAPSLITPGATGEIEERTMTKTSVSAGRGNGD